MCARAPRFGPYVGDADACRTRSCKGQRFLSSPAVVEPDPGRCRFLCVPHQRYNTHQILVKIL